MSITSPTSIEVYASDRDALPLSQVALANERTDKDFSLVTWSNESNDSTNFTGAYAVKNWTEHTSATVASLWNLTQLPGAITLNTDPNWQVSTDWMTILVAATGVITFDWTCNAGAGAQNPCYYSVNDGQTQLNASATSGTVSVFVELGDVFSISCGSGNAVLTSLTITNFMAPVPNASTCFAGNYAVKNWTERTSATVASLWNLSQLPQAITLNTDPNWQVSTDWMTILVAATGLIRFDWTCSSGAGAQYPCYYSVNDIQVQLNSSSANGTATVLVNVGDVFSVSCGSSDAALSSLTLSNFVAPVPNQSTCFTAAYAVKNWTEHTSATVSSLWNLAQLPQAITLNTDPNWQVSTDWMTIVVAATGLIRFDWICSVGSGTQTPCYYNINDVQVQLNASATSGTVNVFVNLGDAFSISCGSSNASVASLTISDFIAPAPNDSTCFADAYAVQNWTEHTSATVSSLWNLAQLPQTITLNTDMSWQVSTDWMTIVVPATGLIRFDWACSSSDGTHQPCSYSVNDAQVQLNATASSGTASVIVKLGDIFSISCESNNASQNSLAISNFVAPVPTEINYFTSAYAIANWTEGTSASAGSLWNLSHLPLAMSLNTDPNWQVSTDWMTITVPTTGLIRFDWACSSNNGSQNPCYYSVNGRKVQLNSTAASGTASVFVSLGDTFSISCEANSGGLTSLTLSNFMAIFKQTKIPLMREVVRKLAPNIRIHSKEQFFPASVDWYLPQVALYDVNNALVTPFGSVTAQSISALGQGYQLVVNDSGPNVLGVYSNSAAVFQTYQGQLPTDGVCPAPCYYHVVEDNDLVYLTYYCFYAFNGGMGPTASWTVGPGPMGSEWGFASHEGDWEQVNVVLQNGPDNSTVIIRAINREAHGDAQWEYHDRTPITISALMPITVYSSWHSHALRPSSGNYDLGGSGIDYCDDGGPVWNTSSNLISLDDNPPAWVTYAGDFGTHKKVNFVPGTKSPLRLGGPDGPVNKPSWTLAGMRELYYGIGIFTPGVPISGQGTSVPAMTTFNNTVHMVYTGAHSSTIYHTSTVDGTDWTEANVLEGKSSLLALASLSNCMVLIAPDTNNTKQLWCSQSSDGVKWTELKRIEGQSSAKPALAAFGTSVHMVYPSSSANDPTLYHTFSANGQDWSAPKVISNSKAYSVALTQFNGALAMVYSDSHSSQLWVSFYQNDQTGWSTPAQIPEQGTSQPAALSFDGSLVVVYTGTHSSQLWVTRSKDGKGWSKPLQIVGQGTSVPALTNIPSTLHSVEKLLLVYTGAHSSQLYAALAMD